MKRYAVTLTRTITQTATFLVEADNVGDAVLKAEDIPWSEAIVTSSHDNVGEEDGWFHGPVTEVTDSPRRSVRRRLAAAIGCGEQPRPPRRPQ